METLTVQERWQIYEVAVYTAWGDERLAPDEVSAARAVAEELDLDQTGYSPGSVLRAGPPILADIGLDRLSRRAQHVAYATAAWVSFADGRQHPAERAVLLTLRYRMDLEADTASILEFSALLTCAHRPVTSPRLRYRALLQAIDDVVGVDAHIPGVAVRRPRALSAGSANA